MDTAEENTHFLENDRQHAAQNLLAFLASSILKNEREVGPSSLLKSVKATNSYQDMSWARTAKPSYNEKICKTLGIRVNYPDINNESIS